MSDTMTIPEAVEILLRAVSELQARVSELEARLPAPQ